ncbi:putative uncharacterized protein DDB_G0271606 isoform X9 [Drosophila bipectinata]|uniref:putative uncharacterized protein DDB_G0271606 isoform X9 n=1 Tax=Drosophila bipectinata TaxID=42026 RepID=UPI001C89D759|nr:putative uncharacterized protein DDB_G0271606 isoform X6 [Drosophila bipectinata]
MANVVNMNSLLNGKDSRWLQLEVCREFQRNKCSRQDTECKFAHPPANVEVQNGKVTACYDSIKGRCNRDKPPCKYFHPPQHLKDQLLINGRNHLALKNALMQQMGIAPGQPVISSQVPTVATNPYLTGIPANSYSPYYATGHLVPTLLTPDHTAVASQLGPVVPQTVQVAQQKIPRSDRLEQFSGMVPFKRPAAEKSGIPVYQPGATAYQQLMQPYVPVSCEYPQQQQQQLPVQPQQQQQQLHQQQQQQNVLLQQQLQLSSAITTTTTTATASNNMINNINNNNTINAVTATTNNIITSSTTTTTTTASSSSASLETATASNATAPTNPSDSDRDPDKETDTDTDRDHSDRENATSAAGGGDGSDNNTADQANNQDSDQTLQNPNPNQNSTSPNDCNTTQTTKPTTDDTETSDTAPAAAPASPPNGTQTPPSLTPPSATTSVAESLLPLPNGLGDNNNYLSYINNNLTNGLKPIHPDEANGESENSTSNSGAPAAAPTTPRSYAKQNGYYSANGHSTGILPTPTSSAAPVSYQTQVQAQTNLQRINYAVPAYSYGNMYPYGGVTSSMVSLSSSTPSYAQAQMQHQQQQQQQQAQAQVQAQAQAQVQAQAQAHAQAQAQAQAVYAQQAYAAYAAAAGLAPQAATAAGYYPDPAALAKEVAHKNYALKVASAAAKPVASSAASAAAAYTGMTLNKSYIAAATGAAAPQPVQAPQPQQVSMAALIQMQAQAQAINAQAQAQAQAQLRQFGSLPSSGLSTPVPGTPVRTAAVGAGAPASQYPSAALLRAPSPMQYAAAPNYFYPGMIPTAAYAMPPNQAAAAQQYAAATAAAAAQGGSQGSAMVLNPYKKMKTS